MISERKYAENKSHTLSNYINKRNGFTFVDNRSSNHILMQKRIIQRATVDIANIGRYDSTLTPANPRSGTSGVHMKLKFTIDPARGLPRSSKIGFIQVVKSQIKGSMYGWNRACLKKTSSKMLVSSKGYRIDSMYNNPVYGGKSLKPGDGIEKTTPARLMYGCKIVLGSWNTPAEMEDIPNQCCDSSKTLRTKFITRAIDLNNKVYLGAVQWGYELTTSGNAIPIDITESPMLSGSPSRDFQSAIIKWNSLKCATIGSKTLLVNSGGNSYAPLDRRGITPLPSGVSPADVQQLPIQ